MKTEKLNAIWHSLKNIFYQKKVLWQVISVFIILFGIAFITRAIISNWNEIRTQHWEINLRYVFLAVLLFPIGMLPTAAAWHKLAQAFGIRAKFRTNLYFYSISLIPRHIPGYILFVTSRTLSYQERGVPAAIILAATVSETGLLALTGFIIATPLLVLGIDSSSSLSAIRIVSLLAPIILILVIAATPKINKVFFNYLTRKKVENIPQLNRSNLLWSLLWMFIAWGGGGLLLFILGQAIVPVRWSLLPLLIGMWGAAGGVSLTIGIGFQGLGIREVTLGALLSIVFPPLVAVVLAIAFRLVLTIGEFLWVAILVWITRKYSLAE